MTRLWRWPACSMPRSASEGFAEEGDPNVGSGSSFQGRICLVLLVFSSGRGYRCDLFRSKRLDEFDAPMSCGLVVWAAA